MSGIATLAYNLIAAGGAKASSYQARYSPANVLLGKVQRPWRSLALGSDWLELDFGAPVTIAQIAANAVNMGLFDVYAGAASDPSHLWGRLLTGADKQGRIKGSVNFGTGGSTTLATSPVFNPALGGLYTFTLDDSTVFRVGSWITMTAGGNSLAGQISDDDDGTITMLESSATTSGTPTSIAAGTAVTLQPVRFVRMKGIFFNQDETDYWQIASVFAFANVAALDRDPLFGESANDLNHPQVRVDLANGTSVADSSGPSYMTPTLAFSGGAADDHEQIVRLAKAGLCWLNLNDGNLGDQWPVKHFEPKTTRRFAGFNRETVAVPLKEVVAL